MLQIVLATWRSGLRSRYFHAVALLAGLLVATAYLAAAFSPRAPSTVALDVGISGLRISLVLLGLLWVQEIFSSEVDRRTVNLLLSYPISRGNYLIARFLGIAALGAVAATALGLALVIASVAAGAGYEAQQFRPDLGLPLLATVFGVWLESIVVVAFALLVSAVGRTPMLPFVAGAGFALAGKGLGAAIDYVMTGADKSLPAANLPALQAIHWLLPDLSRLDWRYWPMYQMSPDMAILGWSVAAALAYVGIMLGLAVWTFGRREFS